jgi:hypothetical protein
VLSARGLAGCGDVTADVIVRAPAQGECRSDTDCVDAAGEPRCELTSGDCVACVEPEDCTDRSGNNEGDDDDDDNERLCSSAGRCVECLDDGHCDDVGETCSTVLGECARPCSAPADCNDGDAPICDLNIGYCVECRTDQECDDDELCRGSECVDED